MPLRINLNDQHLHLALAPHTLFKPAPFLRCGIMNLLERYAVLSPDIEIGFYTVPYLSEAFSPLEHAIEVDASIFPNKSFVQALLDLKPGEALRYHQRTVAKFGEEKSFKDYNEETLVHIHQRWDLPKLNGVLIQEDYKLLTSEKTSTPLPDSCRLIGDHNLFFMEEGAVVNDATINVQGGPVYLSAHSEVMEGSLIRGPFALGLRSQLKMGAKIYGGTTVGPDCKVGGEINNVIFESYSNKSHDGFLGNGYISSWCNIGADTNASNLMNNYGIVDVHDYSTGKTISSGEQFVGLHMGDHSKCGINTMFNTGTAVGIACNLYGPGFFKKHIPSFSFGEPMRLFPYRFDKAVEGIQSMMARRGKELSQGDIEILKHILQERDSF